MGRAAAVVLCLGLVGAGPAWAQDGADPAALLARLGARYLSDREAAVEAIAKLPADAQKALVPELVKIVAEQGWLAQSSAASALRKIGPRAKGAVPGLQKALSGALKRKQWALSDMVLDTIMTVDPDAAKLVVREIASLLKDDDPRVRDLACRSLARIGPPAVQAVGALCEAAKSEDAAVRLGAVRALGAIGPGAQAAVPVLCDALASSDEAVSLAAANALAGLGPAAKQAVPELLGALKSTDGRLAQTAAAALGAIRIDTPEAINALVGALGHRSREVPGAAGEALIRIGPPAVTAMTEALQNRNIGISAAAARILAKIGPDAKSAVPALMTAVRGKDDRLRYESVQTLGAIGAGAEQAVPMLADLLDNFTNQDKRLAQYAAGALGRIGPAAKKAVPALLASIEDEDLTVQLAAIKALGLIGPDAKPAVDRILKVLNGEKPEPAQYAADALAGIGEAGKKAVPDLLRIARKDPDVRPNAVKALGALAVDAPSAIALLTDLLKGDAKRPYNFAPDLFAKAPPKDRKQALDALANLMNDKDAQLVDGAARAILTLNPDVETKVGVVVALGNAVERSAAAEKQRLTATLHGVRDQLLTDLDDAPADATKKAAACIAAHLKQAKGKALKDVLSEIVKKLQSGQ